MLPKIRIFWLGGCGWLDPTDVIRSSRLVHVCFPEKRTDLLNPQLHTNVRNRISYSVFISTTDTTMSPPLNITKNKTSGKGEKNTRQVDEWMCRRCLHPHTPPHTQTHTHRAPSTFQYKEELVLWVWKSKHRVDTDWLAIDKPHSTSCVGKLKPVRAIDSRQGCLPRFDKV